MSPLYDSGSVAGGGTRSDLRGIVHSAPHLSLKAVELSVHPPNNGWHKGSISSIAADRSSLIYLFQRGNEVDPIVVVDRNGHVVRSWGKGMYIKAHAIRLDPQGNILDGGRRDLDSPQVRARRSTAHAD